MGKYLDGIKKVRRAITSKETPLPPSPVKFETPSKRPLVKERRTFDSIKNISSVGPSGKVKALSNFFNFFALSERWQERRAERERKQEQRRQEREERLRRKAGEQKEKMIQEQNIMEESKKSWQAEKQKQEKIRRAKMRLRAEKLAAKLKAKEDKKIIKQERRAARRKKREKMIKKWRNNFKEQRKKIAVGFILLVFILAIFSGASSYIVYTRKPSENIVAVLINKLPFPALIINWQPVRYSIYLKELRLFGDYYVSETGDKATDKSRLVKGKLIEYSVIKKLAARYGVKLNDREKEEAFQKLAAINGGLEKFTEKIYNEYGLTKELFIDRVVYYQALREKIKQAFVQDDRLHQGAVLRLDKVDKLLQKNKGDFEALAQKYSEDLHALQGGDVGYVKTSAMDEPLKTAVQNLPVGEISPVIKTENKYYIVKVYDKKVNKKQEEEIWLKQITIFTNYDFDKYLADLQAKAKVWVLVK